MNLSTLMPFKPSKHSSSSYISLAFPSPLSKILERISDFTLTKLRLYPILSASFITIFNDFSACKPPFCVV